MRIVRGLVFVLFCACSPVFADTLINAWTNPTSGNWEDLKWSLGIRPGPGQSIMLTNQGWKAIAIGPNTVQNFSETLNVSSVILGGYTDSFNTLLLNYAGFAVPLTASSIDVGTNSGITALASALTVSSNSGPGVLSIFSVFNQGEQAIVNAHLINLGNFANPVAGFGTYNQTNGSINADEVSAAGGGSTFNQFNGSNTIGTLWMGSANTSNYGQYNMVNGSLTAGSIELYRGEFNQTGGSVTAGLGLGSANYTLSAGTLRLPGITIPNVPSSSRNPSIQGMGVNATLLQTGGTNFCDGSLIVYREDGSPAGSAFTGPGHYVLSNGVLCVSSTVWSGYYGAGGDFQQWGGWHTNAGILVKGDTAPNWVLKTSSFKLGGGTLITPSISIGLGDFTQSGGTNRVGDDVDVGTAECPATFTLSGGLLTDLNTDVDASTPATPGPQPALFTQSGGTHIVTNLLRIFGPRSDLVGSQYTFARATYALSGGVLNAPNILMVTNAFFDHAGGTVTTSGLLTLGYATWNEKTTGQQFGQLLLSAPAGTNATFSLPPGNSCIVRFANSSFVAWSNQVNFLVANWNGSPTGGGQHQVIFGSNASGLTPQQLSQIQFVDPDGVSGMFPARILATGELVPDRFVAARTASNNLMIEWSSGTLQSATNVIGPYQDVSGANSPYTAPFTGLQRFFRLRK